MLTRAWAAQFQSRSLDSPVKAMSVNVTTLRVLLEGGFSFYETWLIHLSIEQSGQAWAAQFQSRSLDSPV